MDLFDQLEEMDRPQVEKREWMDRKEMRLVTSIEMLEQVADECIASGRYSWDVETTGLDSRVFYADDGTTFTNDKIVGHCLSPDGHKGYYAPVRHVDGRGGLHEANLPVAAVNKSLKRLSDATMAKKTVGIFHNGKFDHEMLQFSESIELGEWDDPATFEDTLILAYVRNTRERRKSLKHLSFQELGYEMIELEDLFTPEQRKQGGLNFAQLDPTWEPSIWYGCSDAICTYLLCEGEEPDDGEDDDDGFVGLRAQVHDPEPTGLSQAVVYKLEKMTLPATRWMERSRIHIDRDKVKELIRLGQTEWFDSLEAVYVEAQRILGRDVRPGWYRLMRGTVDISAAEHYRFDPTKMSPDYKAARDDCIKGAKQHKLDPTAPDGKGKEKVRRIVKEVPMLTNPRKKEKVGFLQVYDVTIAAQLGMMLREMGVKGLKATEKSGQVATDQKTLDGIFDRAAKQFPFMGKIQRFRQTKTALANNLFPILWDSTPERSPDGCIRVNFNGHKVDTGRFATPKPRIKEWFGQVRWNLHSIPAGYQKDRPECMLRIRECVSARPGKVLFAIDYAGVELRIVTNISGEAKWIDEFFRCSSCDNQFPRDRENPPPPFCPECGSDKIGDLHSLTAFAIYGDEIKGTKEFKGKRQKSKALNFAMCYGGGGSAAQRAVDVDKDEGWRIKRQFDATYTGLQDWWQRQHRFAKRYKFVTTAFGRRYPLPDIDHQMKGFVEKAKRNAVNGPVQGCLHPDCRIPTSEGLVAVRELYEKGEGFRVWTGQGWSEARPLFSGEKAVRVTEFSSGTTIKTSPEHLFLSWQDSMEPPQGKGDVLEWIRQQNLTKGSWVAVSTAPLEWPEPKYQWKSETHPQEGHLFSEGMTPHNYKGFSIDGNSEAMWEFLGLIYGDGSIHANRLDLHVGESKIEGHTGPTAEALANEYADRLNAALGVGAHTYRKRRPVGESHKSDMWQVKVCNKAFRAFCRDVLGVQDENTYTKRFPHAVWRESMPNRAAFLRGYFGADGSTSATGDAVSVRSVNLGLLRDAHDLLRSLGIRSSYRPKSLRVSVLDRVRFHETVGFTVAHKNKRLANMKMNPWLNQWDLAPPGLVRWVGETVCSSNIYKDLPREQKSAAIRLKAGSGSRFQCVKYLDKLPVEDVPAVLRELLQYGWEQVVSSNDPGETTEMYDVKVLDGFHAFVADGCVVHNTSADITKLSMALVYLLCKKRGWLRRVCMTITIHDELVYEIDKAIAEEAVEHIVHTMTRNKYLMRLNHLIGYKCDIEFGEDWTVPHNLTEMAHNAENDKTKHLPGGGQWTPELAKVFPKSYASFLSHGGTPLEGYKAPDLPDDAGTEAEQVSSTPGTDTPAPAKASGPAFETPETGKGKVCVHVVHTSKLSYGLMDRLATVIHKVEGRGLETLRVQTENGVILYEDPRTMISATQFKVLAEEYKV